MAEPKGRTRGAAQAAPERRVVAAPHPQPSQYANHVAVLAAGTGDSGEVTFRFYQVSADDLASGGPEVTALPLGSIVMQRGFAEDFVRNAAQTLGIGLEGEAKADATP
ncbi:MAG TPA: hypothetical protein PLQ54_18275 [Armatimonadota bacterium]|nr:hypothetical protein [Armatimonadota bacterium]